MEYNNLLELIKTVSESNLCSFKYEDGATKIHMSSGELLDETDHEELQCMTATASTDLKKEESTASGENIREVNSFVETEGNIVKSPLVGTFYMAASEDGDPFVSIGDHVKVGDTLAIVEAMKLMNDIESDYDGIVTKVFVKNGDNVEYGQPLFMIGA